MLTEICDNIDMEVNPMIDQISPNPEASSLDREVSVLSIGDASRGGRKPSEIISDIKALPAYDTIALDTEATGLSRDAKLLGVSFCGETGRAFWLSADNIVPSVLETILAGKQLIMHNAKFDLQVLKRNDIDLYGNQIFDTMIAHQLLDENERHGLKHLAQTVLGEKVEKEWVGKSGFPKERATMEQSPYIESPLLPIDDSELVDYACADADYTFQLYFSFAPQLKQENLSRLFYTVEMPLVKSVAQMEDAGIFLDTEKIIALQWQLQEENKAIVNEIFSLAGKPFDLNSSTQLSALLYDKLSLESVKKTPSGKQSTDIESLEAIKDAHPIVSKILRYREILKLLSTYLEKLPSLVDPVTKRIHCNLHQNGTVTGRFSCSEPNLQNIPRGDIIRSAFIPSPDHVFIDADFSQIELRCIAHYTQDENMLAAYYNDADLHKKTIADMLGKSIDAVTDSERFIAKSIDFGLAYGMGPRGLSKRLGVSKEEAQGLIDKYFGVYSKVKGYIHQHQMEVQNRGYVVNMFGRRRRMINRDYHKAFNALIQSTATDICKIQMVRLAEQLPEDARKTYNNFVIGDKVLVKDDGQSLFGTVSSLSDDSVEVRLENGDEITCDKSNPSLRSRTGLAKPIETVDEMFWRVAQSVAKAESERAMRSTAPSTKESWASEFFQLLSGWKFIPGGRILSAAGEENLTYYNCFVLPSPKDSREGIITTLHQMVEIMSRGGGVGINLSSLRPKDSSVRGVSGRSSGAVSWGALYSFATGLICQGGSRRGALGLVLNDWHPDVLGFIKSKRNNPLTPFIKGEEGGAFTNANISVAISDAFMKALENDSDWQLVFPDTRHPEYDAQWNGDLQTWVDLGYPVLTYKTIKAKELWDAIVENAWTNGEPGIWFIDKANASSNSHYFGRLNCTNPCFEEPLPAFGVCCLGSLNLPAFINGNDIAWEELENAIKTAVRFLGDVISVTPYFHYDIEERQTSERRIGLGTMGLAEVLIKLGLRYGSDESLTFILKLYGFIAKTAYLASVSLAEEKGRFPAYTDELLQSGFMKNMPPEVRGEVKQHGIRNMTLLTQTPTGSIATMVGTSTGIEPFFDFRYARKSQLGVDEEYVKVYAEWKEAHAPTPNPSKEGNESLPDYFVTTKDITTDEHVAVQAAVQRWVDASISKTVNLPSEATKDDVSNVFIKLYESGCKGGTVYRDGSRKEQVLNRQEPTDDLVSIPVSIHPSGTQPKVLPQESADKDRLSLSQTGQSTAQGVGVKELPYKRQGATVSMKTPSGTAHITMNHDDSGQPFEVFIEIGKAGSSIKAMAEAIGRLISLIFRLEPIPPTERAVRIMEQLSGIGGARSVGFGKNKVLSLPDAVSKALAEHYELPILRGVAVEPTGLSADICPVCGQSSYVREEGCTHCLSCGYSEC